MNKAKTENAQTAPTEVEMTQALRVEALSYITHLCGDNGWEQLSHGMFVTWKDGETEAEAQGHVCSVSM